MIIKILCGKYPSFPSLKIEKIYICSMKGRVLNISHFVLCTQLFIVNDFATHHASYLLFRHFPIVKCTFCPFIHVHFRCWSHPVRPTADKKKNSQHDRCYYPCRKRQIVHLIENGNRFEAGADYFSIMNINNRSYEEEEGKRVGSHLDY